VGADQLERLEQLLQRLGPGPRILVTHYPACMASGKLERRSHRLRDVHALADAARAGGVALWLHGHLHRAFRHGSTEMTPFPVICAGSSTQSWLWSYGEYTLTGRQLRAVCRVYHSTERRFRDGETFELSLPE
jgi:3',5'-cyclic AMP phosphodiesterase CpdA